MPKNHFDELCCAYGEGYTGTVRLRTAMAKHLNTHFRPAQAIDAEQVTFAAGVTDLNEVCALITCDPDKEGVDHAWEAHLWSILQRSYDQNGVRNWLRGSLRSY